MTHETLLVTVRTCIHLFFDSVSRTVKRRLIILPKKEQRCANFCCCKGNSGSLMTANLSTSNFSFHIPSWTS